MSKEYKNTLKLKNGAVGEERRANIAKEILKDSTPLPHGVEYQDIDEEFKRWVEDDLDIDFEGSKVPTVALFSNQRFTEYMQTWQNVDDKKNMLLNFKAITRENNPKGGSVVGQTRNIPGERTVLLRRVAAEDHAGRRYYIDYRMKQPFAIDIIYTVSIVTNKYEMLNEFNLMVNNKFKAINCYIRPNGYFMAMELNDITDESDYSIDNRRFYSQSYNIKVMAYIIREDDFVVEERPELKFKGMEGDRDKTSYAEIEDLPCGYDGRQRYEYAPMMVTVHIEPCDSKYKFTIDCDFVATDIEYVNVRAAKIFVNDTERELAQGLSLKSGDNISIKGVAKYRYAQAGEIKMNGYDPNTAYTKGSANKTIKVEYS